MNIIDNPAEVFRPPLQSRATRKISLRSKASARGLVVARLPADPHPRKIWFESWPEYKCLLLLLAMAEVYNIWDQPPKIRYRNRDGKFCNHTFDYLVTLTNGERIAIAVKPAALVIKRDFVDELSYVAAAVPLDFADRVWLITEKNLNKDEVANAEMLHAFRRKPDVEADEAIDGVIADLKGGMTIGSLVEVSGLGARGFRAIVRAIFDGKLSAPRQEKITYATRVEVVA